jgi:hypothetical protein
MMDTLRYSGTSVLTKSTWRNTPEYGILHIKGDEIDVACNMKGREQGCVREYGGKTERNGLDWIDLAQDMRQWNSLVKTVTSLRVSKVPERWPVHGFSRSSLHEVGVCHEVPAECLGNVPSSN